MKGCHVVRNLLAISTTKRSKTGSHGTHTFMNRKVESHPKIERIANAVPVTLYSRITISELRNITDMTDISV